MQFDIRIDFSKFSLQPFAANFAHTSNHNQKMCPIISASDPAPNANRTLSFSSRCVLHSNSAAIKLPQVARSSNTRSVPKVPEGDSGFLIFRFLYLLSGFGYYLHKTKDAGFDGECLLCSDITK
ncbi:hypothetical protein Zmor_000165 [Zophobas morio]|uniref:Uncharacterized protein n=1 Tax=Zophobas morio TaxID=2755281 RepID=A0AA38MQ89_9CUCU|nr:hypothetical protein Zmor_000165 [Zophobas morio]